MYLLICIVVTLREALYLHNALPKGYFCWLDLSGPSRAISHLYMGPCRPAL